jgi:hypothetical protein
MDEATTFIVFSFMLFCLWKRKKSREHNSILSGRLYFREVMDSENEAKWKTATRMSKGGFEGLLSLLESGGSLKSCSHGGCCAGEKLMTFLYILGHGASIRLAADRFQHSTKTISQSFHEVLNSLMKVSSVLLVKHPAQQAQPEIRNNFRFASFFDKYCSIYCP